MNIMAAERSKSWLSERAAQYSNVVTDDLRVVTDTTEFMNINRGHVLHLEGR
jgi:hypothetical protein